MRALLASVRIGRDPDDRLRELGVPVYDQAAAAAELGRYSSFGGTGASAAASEPVVPFDLPPHDAEAELRDYNARGQQ